MSISIYYRGRAHSKMHVDAAIAQARRFAGERGWPVAAEAGGVLLTPGECEPFSVVFAEDFVIEGHTKTQLAGPEVHLQLVSLLRELSIHVVWEEVFDDAEAWEGATSREVHNAFQRMNILVQRRAAEGGGQAFQRLPDGRIVDVAGGDASTTEWRSIVTGVMWVTLVLASMIGLAFAYSWWVGLI